MEAHPYGTGYADVDLSSTIEWSHLDKSSLTHIAECLKDYKSLLSLQLTCKAMYEITSLNCVWATLLEEDFGLRFKECGNLVLQSVYKQLKHNVIPYPIRYAGLFTDGGCDATNLSYWVDNMFDSYKWSAYCSEISPNVHCFGLIQPDVVNDPYSARERQFLLDRIKYPYAYQARARIPPEIAGDDAAAIQWAHEKLSQWPTPKLQRRFLRLFLSLQNNDLLGNMLMIGLPGSQEQVHNTLMQLAQRIFMRVGSLASPGEFVVDELPGCRLNRRQLLLFEQQQMLRLATGKASNTFGFFNAVSICRKGDLTCPVLAGAIYVSNATGELVPGAAAAAMATASKAATPGNRDAVSAGCKKVALAAAACVRPLAEQAWVTALNNARDSAVVLAAAEAGTLPKIVRHEQFVYGEYIEFESVSGVDPLTMVPVLWFHFKTKMEVPLGPAPSTSLDSEGSSEEEMEDEQEAEILDMEEDSSLGSFGDEGDEDDIVEDFEGDDDDENGEFYDEEIEGEEDEMMDAEDGQGWLDIEADSGRNPQAQSGQGAGRTPEAPTQNGASEASGSTAAAAATRPIASSHDGSGPGVHYSAEREGDKSAGMAGSEQAGPRTVVVAPGVGLRILGLGVGLPGAERRGPTLAAGTERQGPSTSAGGAGTERPAASSSAGVAAAGPSSASLASDSLLTLFKNEWLSRGTQTSQDRASAKETTNDSLAASGGAGTSAAESSATHDFRCIRRTLSEAPPITIHPPSHGGHVSDAFSARRNSLSRMIIQLQHPRIANLVMVKLITHEDRMQEMQDTHDHPNVDIQYVAFKGVTVTLPANARLAL